MGWWMQRSPCFLIVYLFWLSYCQGRRAPKAALWRFRGGNADETTTPQTRPHYSVVSTVVVRGNNNSKNDPPVQIEPGCALFPNGDLSSPALWRSPAAWSDNSPSLWHTLGLLSDVVVLVLENNNNSPVESQLVDALVQGLRQRTHTAGLPKGRLLIFLNAAVEEDLETWKERVMMEGNALNADLLQEFFVANTLTFSEAVLDILRKNPTLHHGVSGLLEASGFPQLLQQVYQSMGGDEEEESLVLPEESSAPKTDQQQQSNQVTNQPSNPKSTKKEPIHSNVDSDTALSATDRETLATTLQALDQVQAKQEERWLQPSDDDDNNLPQDFADMVDPILERLAAALATSAAEASAFIQENVGHRLRQLHGQHLKELRDYYGVLYERLLEENVDLPGAWPAAARRVSQEFRQAGENSIPRLAREGGVFRDMDLDYVGSFAGLLADMQQATELEEALFDMDEEEEADVAENHAARRPAKWYEKVAARGLVLGVNYLQGWLAWQGIRRAALERERKMPKFPLF